MTTTTAQPARRRLPYWVRWLHLYGSMLGLMATMLFAVTGLTLNHADWFENGEPTVRSLTGTLPAAALVGEIDKLVVAETLRAAHTLRGSVSEFAVDEDQCLIVWKGPGYSADATVERATGAYRLEEQRRGWVAVLDDLHKGRDSGPTWSLVVDVSAVLLALIAGTGLWLLFYLKKRLRYGLLVALVGTVALLFAFVFGVP